ncbi:MAG TPA: competence/damage-inducible protein A [Clostridia bacterium]|nr:competence/damage-inducible protein A [Clostridia bacterium]
MLISIINVGNEVLDGDVLNSNAQFLSKELYQMGHEIKFHSVCQDGFDDILSVLKFFTKASDLIILTGGLGPTEDDMTKEVLADFLNRKLVKNDDVLLDIKNKFKKFNSKMTENNIKQAYVIEDAKILFNKKGTAPGFILESVKCNYILLPGPPREMKYLFDEYIRDYLKDDKSSKIQSRIIKIDGVGESTVASEINDLIQQKNIYVATYAKMGEVKVKLSTTQPSDILDFTKNEIIKRFKKNIISYSEKETYISLCEHLIQNNISISTAESCTGGLLASKIVENPGISKIYFGSFITYSNDMKSETLGVNKASLREHGAVSEMVAREMILGLYEKTKTDICVAITGIAGPNGGTKEKPVGLVYIAFKIFEDIFVIENNFRGNRNEIRERSVNKVFNVLSKKLIIDN